MTPPKSESQKRVLPYTEQDMVAAYMLVQDGKCSANKAARLHGVPRSTLLQRLGRKQPYRQARSCAFTNEEEMYLVDWIKECNRQGLTLTHRHIRLTVQSILNDRQAVSIFKDNLPGEKWITLFFKRHPEVSIKKKTRKPKPAPRSRPVGLFKPLSSSIELSKPSLSSIEHSKPSLSSAEQVGPSCPTELAAAPSQSSLSDHPSALPSPSPLQSESTPTHLVSASAVTTTIVGSSNGQLLDMLLDIAARVGPTNLNRLKCMHMLNKTPESPEEELFLKLYDQLLRNLSNPVSSATGPNTSTGSVDNHPAPSQRVQNRNYEVVLHKPNILSSDAYRGRDGELVNEAGNKKRKVEQNKEAKKREESKSKKKTDEGKDGGKGKKKKSEEEKEKKKKEIGKKRHEKEAKSAGKKVRNKSHGEAHTTIKGEPVESTDSSSRETGPNFIPLTAFLSQHALSLINN